MKGLPQLIERQTQDDSAMLTLHVPADNPWFEGHFPGHPILPGVVQIGWAAWFATEFTGLDLQPQLLERIKFRHPVNPPADLTLQLTRQAGKLAFEFRLLSPDGPIAASSGVFVLPP